MKTKDEITYNYANEFLWHLMPFGSLDIMHLVEKAYEFNITPRRLAGILHEQAENFDIDLFENNRTTDLNALFNVYILNQAVDNINQVLDIDLYDYDVYFFANYLDYPLRYSNEVVKDIKQAIEDKGKDNIELNEYSKYILDIMRIEYEQI